ncbi:hypothetical protein NG896_20995 [Aeromonas veronii]|uniref:hypothetical protein n=1 Tax=Aeromonas TaxID=642 RepID=UPI001117CA8B|nr:MULTISPECIES: hypothetical protein [Aeromonas]MCO5345039.1 hypothetical protein [Aeromonas veronii]WFO53399.1 hypothetical protein L1O00_10490 [Aeromonas veronii]WFO53411.1 hypothetical protein L1O00_10550 [Aeromonas veronii]
MQFKVTPNDGDPIVHGFTENRTHFMVGSLIPNGSIIHYEVNDECVFQRSCAAKTVDEIKEYMLYIHREYLAQNQ